MATDGRIGVKFSKTRTRRLDGCKIIVRYFNQGAVGRVVAGPMPRGWQAPHRCRSATVNWASIHTSCVEKHCVSYAWYSRTLARLFRRRRLQLFGLSGDGLV